MKQIQIAIDGPDCGKSTVAKIIAKDLGYAISRQELRTVQRLASFAK